LGVAEGGRGTGEGAVIERRQEAAQLVQRDQGIPSGS
jgi:hypothetical protein